MNVSNANSPRWWQWLTIVSLDAPAVSLAWQWLLGRVAGTALGWPPAAILGASVWLAYAADRWFEALRLPPDRIVTPRHRFYAQHRRSVAAMWVLVLVADIVVAVTQLTSREFLAGCGVLGAVLAYLLSHQLIHRDARWRAPKEVCVAALLAGGVALFIVTQPGATLSALMPPLVLFALLCFVNCALISAWEMEVDLTHGQTSLARQLQSGAAIGRTLPWLLALAAGAMALAESGPKRTASLCALASSLLLAGVDRLEPRIGWRGARVLADVVLLTPLVPLFRHTLA